MLDIISSRHFVEPLSNTTLWHLISTVIARRSHLKKKWIKVNDKLYKENKTPCSSVFSGTHLWDDNYLSSGLVSCTGRRQNWRFKKNKITGNNIDWPTLGFHVTFEELLLKFWDSGMLRDGLEKTAEPKWRIMRIIISLWWMAPSLAPWSVYVYPLISGDHCHLVFLFIENIIGFKCVYW